MMSMPTEPHMRAAIAARDASYNGQFYYGVITTGVFCQPSCPSRPAKAEHLRFFASVSAAMTAGFRPCLRCQPSQTATEPDTARPDAARPNAARPNAARLIRIAEHIETHADERLTLATLAKLANLSPSRLQRLFKAAFGISPKVYQDAVRMREFKHSLQTGDTVTEAINTAGFGSSSRVYGEAGRQLGMTPSAYRAGGVGEVIHYACRTTALGPMMMAATARGICFVQFDDDEAKLLARLQSEFPKAQLLTSPNQTATDLDHWMLLLDQHISDGAPRPDLPLDMRGTAFQMKVWQFLIQIPEGDVISYTELAQHIGQPKAARAAASACARNRIGVLIPCHRVLRGDGGLGGYRWGLERKRALLDAERPQQQHEIDIKMLNATKIFF